MSKWTAFALEITWILKSTLIIYFVIKTYPSKSHCSIVSDFCVKIKNAFDHFSQKNKNKPNLNKININCKKIETWFFPTLLMDLLLAPHKSLGLHKPQLKLNEFESSKQARFYGWCLMSHFLSFGIEHFTWFHLSFLLSKTSNILFLDVLYKAVLFT